MYTAGTLYVTWYNICRSCNSTVVILWAINNIYRVPFVVIELTWMCVYMSVQSVLFNPNFTEIGSRAKAWVTCVDK